MRVKLFGLQRNGEKRNDEENHRLVERNGRLLPQSTGQADDRYGRLQCVLYFTRHTCKVYGTVFSRILRTVQFPRKEAMWQVRRDSAKCHLIALLPSGGKPVFYSFVPRHGLSGQP